MRPASPRWRWPPSRWPRWFGCLPLRFGASRSQRLFSPLSLGTLATLLWPNALGIFTGVYQGHGDLTQTYLYSGLLLAIRN